MYLLTSCVCNLSVACDVYLTEGCLLYVTDLKKQSEMASLSKERESLGQTVDMYRLMFETSSQLIEELKGQCLFQ